MKWPASKAEGEEQLFFGRREKDGQVIQQGVFNVGYLHTMPSFHDTEKVMEGKTFTARKSFQPWESSLALSGLQKIHHVQEGADCLISPSACEQ